MIFALQRYWPVLRPQRFGPGPVAPSEQFRGSGSLTFIGSSKCIRWYLVVGTPIILPRLVLDVGTP